MGPCELTWGAVGICWPASRCSAAAAAVGCDEKKEKLCAGERQLQERAQTQHRAVGDL